MNYKKIVEAIFIKRPNRFIAEVSIGGKEEIIHVRNTGRCKELLVPGARVILEDCGHIPTRKTRYSLIAVWKEDILVNMDSQIPNAVVFNSLRDNKILAFEKLTHIRREVSYGDSRFDIYFESEDSKGFIEVKGVTLEDNGVAVFPDAPTSRGTKHVLEMIDASKEGYRSAIIFLIQMKGPREFRLNWQMDKEFSQAIKLAYENGVEILAYDCVITEDSINLDNSIPINLGK